MHICLNTYGSPDATQKNYSASGASEVHRQRRMSRKLKKILVFPVLGLMAIFLTGCEFPKIAKLTDSATPETQTRTNQVTFSADGFSPKTILVPINTKVTFTNLDKGPHTIASDPHPTHDQLQNLYSTPIFKDQTYSYVFSKAGKFGFHLEDNPSISGEIVVE